MKKHCNLSPWRQLLALLTLALLMAGSAPAQNSPPESLAYQGYLTDGAGNALASTNAQNYTVLFRIWDCLTGGANGGPSELWGEQQTVTVNKGYFSVMLGQGNQIATNEPHSSTLSSLFAFNNSDIKPRYIEMTVVGIGVNGGDVTLAPRLQFLSSPYAFASTYAVNADSAVNANNLANAAGTPLVSSSGSTVTVAGNLTDASETVSGSLTVANQANLNGGVVVQGSPTAPGAALGVANVSGPQINAGVWANLSGSDGGFGLFGGNMYMDYNGGRNFKYVNSNGSIGAMGFAVNYPSWNQASVITSGTTSSSAGGLFSPTSIATFTSAGNVGIGTVSPVSKLEVNGLISSDSDINIRAYPGRLTIGGTGSGFGVITAQTGVLTINEGSWANVKIPNGNVSIGGATENIAPLEVWSSIGANFGPPTWYFSITSPSATAWTKLTSGSLPANLSIAAGQGILALGFYVSSDARIKNITGRSDSEHDLQTLMGIQISDYTMVDKIANGNRAYKKVIAQQVEKVYPQAVSRTTNEVPDIFEESEGKAGWIRLTKHLEPVLRVGERVRLISDQADKLYEVTEVGTDGFRVAEPLNGRVFVHGRQVSDFRTVDYDAIAMLNVSATQELAKRLEKVEAREAHLAELEQKASQIAELEQQVSDLKKMVQQLAAASKTGKLAADEPAPASPAARSTPITTASLGN